MNKASFIPILFISLLLSCGGAKEKTSGDEIPQGNVTFDTYLFVRATVNDTLDCDLVYDTGFLMGSMVDTALVSVMENFTLSIYRRESPGIQEQFPIYAECQVGKGIPRTDVPVQSGYAGLGHEL